MVCVLYTPPITQERIILSTSVKPVRAHFPQHHQEIGEGILELEQLLLKEQNTPKVTYYSYDVHLQTENERYVLENWHEERDNSIEQHSQRALQRFQVLCADVYERGLIIVRQPRKGKIYISVEQWQTLLS